MTAADPRSTPDASTPDVSTPDGSRPADTPSPSPMTSFDGSSMDPRDLAEGPREECGVFGIFAPGEDVATLTYYGLYALQHRGQESAGIATSDGTRIVVHKDMGLVNQVFTPSGLAAMPGHVAIGHCRYSTTGSSSWNNAQPAYRESAIGSGIALGHNGNLVNTAEIARMLDVPSGNDSGLMADLLARDPDVSVESAIMEVAPQLRGAFSVVLMDNERVYAFRDPHGVRPLVVGRLPAGGWVVASETAALTITGAVPVREVAPGELVILDDDGMHSRTFAVPTPHFCLFEWVYLARPDHVQSDRSVLYSRREVGRQLAREAPVDADIVIAVPDSGRDAAAGYAAESGLPFADGLVKNRYVGRTFIEPTDSLRQMGIRLKLSPVREIVGERRLVVVDDSIVRGNTSRQLVAMLKAAGAAEVHLRICSPPVKNPCYYGIDMATRAQLIGADMTVEEIRDYVQADSLHYVSLDGLVAQTPMPKHELCRACFDGEYPIPVPEEHEHLAQIKFDFDALEADASSG